MVRVMADNDVQGQFNELLRLCTTDAWSDIFAELSVRVEAFEGMGLARDAPDGEVWRACQDRGVVLFTGNRNSEGTDSLEATIRTGNRPDSLPVITLGDPQRFTRDRRYAEEAAERFLEYLLDIDAYRGAGRLYVP